MGLRLVTPPTSEPVSLHVAKLQTRVRHDDEDTLIQDFVRAARRKVESDAGVQIMPATWEASWASFPGSEFCLELPPLVAITSIEYTDEDDANQVVPTTVYDVDTTVSPGVVFLRSGEAWPVAKRERGSVRVTYQAGWSSGVPEHVEQAVRLLVGHYYENRESVVVGDRFVATSVPHGYDSLISSFSVRSVV